MRPSAGLDAEVYPLEAHFLRQLHICSVLQNMCPVEFRGRGLANPGVPCQPFLCFCLEPWARSGFLCVDSFHSLAREEMRPAWALKDKGEKESRRGGQGEGMGKKPRACPPLRSP